MAINFFRYWLAAALCLIGVAVVAIGGADEDSLQIGIPVFAAGASILFLNALYRVGVHGDTERDDEEQARAYFREHGHWPGDGA